MSAEPSALEKPTVKPASWWPVYHKVWTSTAGAGGGAAIALLAAGQPLANLTYETMCAFAVCPSVDAKADLAIVWTIVLAMLGAWLAGYFKREPPKADRLGVLR